MIPEARRREIRLTSRRLFIGCLLASVGLLLLPVRLTEKLDHALARLLGPLGRAGQEASLAVTKQVETLQRPSVSAEQHDRLRDEYLRAEHEARNLRQVVQQQQEWIERFTGVRQVFGLNQARLMGAEILADESSGHRRQVLLNRGEKDQVHPGQLVLGLAGGATLAAPELSLGSVSVVGRVVSVTERAARVQLLSDPEFSLAVTLEPNPRRSDRSWKARGMLQGDPLRGVVVKMVAAQYPVQTGDGVFATADPAVLPTPLWVGVVEHCKRDDKDPVLWAIAVRPGVDLRLLREVIVVDPLRGERPLKK